MWSRSNTSSVKPCSAPSGSSTRRTGRSRLDNHVAAAIRWLMCSRLRWISARLRTPRTVGIRPTAVYGSDMRALLPGACYADRGARPCDVFCVRVTLLAAHVTLLATHVTLVAGHVTPVGVHVTP